MRLLFLILASATLAAALPATRQPQVAESRAKTLVPFLDNSTFVVARLDLTKPDCDELAFMLPTVQRLLDMKDGLYVNQYRELFVALRARGAKEFYALFGFIGMTSPPVYLVPLADSTNAKAIIKLFGPQGMFQDIQAEQIGAAVVIGNRLALQQGRKVEPVARPEFGQALAAAGESTCQVCIALSSLARQAFEELIPTLPPELGGGPSTILTRGLHWAAMGVNGPPQTALDLTLKGNDEAAAAKLQAWLPAVLKDLAKGQRTVLEDPKTKKLWTEFDAVLNEIQPKKAANAVVLSLSRQQTEAVTQPLIAISQFEFERRMVSGSLRKIATAMHMHHDVNRTLPAPANYDSQGKPLLSWRVLVLPYLQQEVLFKEFKLDEPWDSEHNKKLIAKMPAVYRHPLRQGAAEGKTAFVAPVGKDTVFPGSKGLSFNEITQGDGTSNTVLILEAADDNMVIWTKPEDWQFDPKAPHRGLVDKNRPAFQAAFADASIRLIQNQISAETLRAIITRNGKEVLGDDFKKMVQYIR